MSWLSPDKISSSEYNPQKSVEGFVVKYGETGKKVLGCFNRVDPLHVFLGDNVDEYMGYARRFMEKLGNRNFNDLTQKEISELVKSSFHPDQIGKFATEADLELLAKDIGSIGK